MAGLFNECTYFITGIVLKAALIDVNTKRAILRRVIYLVLYQSSKQVT